LLSAFGLGLLTDLRLPGAWREQPARGPALRLLEAEPQAITADWSGRERIGWEATIDGAAFVVERGRAGDHRFVHGAPPAEDGSPTAGTLAVHHLSPDARVLRCAPADPTDPAWWRVVLDSVLFSVALLQGYEALHAGALATSDGGVVAIAAGTGGGKSTLVSELLLRGLTLMADDVLVLEPPRAAGEPPLAHPAPPLMTVPAARAERLRRGLPAQGAEPGPRTAEGAEPRPAPAAAAAAAAAAGQTIAVVEDERWVAMPVCARPLPLRALVVLNRAPGAGEAAVRPIERPLHALIDSLLRFPRTREREAARFDLAGAIAAHVPIWELRADPAVEPGALAEAVLAGPAAPAEETGAHVSSVPTRC
jgi:hypothetical protein